MDMPVGVPIGQDVPIAMLIARNVLVDVPIVVPIDGPIGVLIARDVPVAVPIAVPTGQDVLWPCL